VADFLSSAFVVLTSEFITQSSALNLLSSAISARYPIHNTLVPSVVLRLCALGSVGIDRPSGTIAGIDIMRSRYIWGSLATALVTNSKKTAKKPQKHGIRA
jgi:hypothetical protein